ncbi:MAG: cyclic nucleotide-binding domain-containing protein [Acidobacteriota bacterium]
MTEDLSRGEQILQRTTLFQGLDNDEIAGILMIGEVKNYNAGAVIFVEGARPDRFYVIYDGQVRISKVVEGMGEEALAILNAGEFFGEMALIEQDCQRSAHAIAHTDVRLMEVPIPAMLELLDNDKALAYKFLWNFCRTLSRRLRETSGKISSLFFLSMHS